MHKLFVSFSNKICDQNVLRYHYLWNRFYNLPSFRSLELNNTQRDLVLKGTASHVNYFGSSQAKLLRVVNNRETQTPALIEH